MQNTIIASGALNMEQTAKTGGTEKAGNFLNNAKSGIKKVASVILQIE